MSSLAITGLLLVLFVLLTDGRYFGKRLMYWFYEAIGPAIFAGRSEEKRWQALAEEAGLKGDENILDVGTAAGDLPLSIARLPEFRGQVVGADWSSRLMTHARKEVRRRNLEARVQFQVVDVRYGLPFPDGDFDVLFCLGLLETLPGPERVLAELRRVLKDDGVMVLSLYRGRAARSVALNLEWYERHLGALGMEELQIAPCRRHHDVVIARFSQTNGRVRLIDP